MKNKHIKKSTFLCVAAAIGFGIFGAAYGASREEIASVQVNAKGSNFQYWQKDSQALAKLRSYVKEVTNPKSPDYIPQRDRIAVFDVDGTLACETAPFCFDFLMMVDRALHDSDYKASARDIANARDVERDMLDAEYRRAIPQAGELWRHFKNNEYKIVASPVMHTETREIYCVYQALYGSHGIYCRPLDIFMSKVDHEKYPQAGQKY